MSEAAEIVEPVLDAASEAILEGIDGTVEVIDAVRAGVNLKILVGSSFVIGVVAGATGGYLFAKKKLDSFYADRASEEILQAKEFYAALNKVDVESGDILSPMEVLEKTHPEAAASLREYRGEKTDVTEEELIAEAKGEQGGPWDDEMDAAQLAKAEARLLRDRPDAIVETKTVTVEEYQETPGRNVFTDPHFELEEEAKHRTPHRPYVISYDEYFAAEKEYDTISLTYYEEDDTLVDEKDSPISDVDKTIGDESLARFGHGSKDNNVVYVRNDKMESDFEITRSTGSYLVEVLGLDPEPEPNSLKHSNEARRAFRRDM